MSAEKPIYVTRPSMAPLSRYVAHLADIWETGILTHNGPKVQELERAIDQLLGVDKTVAVTNGTMAMQMALRALNVTEGEVITTPFSWVATCSSILWERCTPVFVDVDPTTFNIDPDLIEAAITKQTRAILAVHSFSCPCDVERIALIAKAHDLRVVYDGAHAFGVQLDGRSLLDWGDVATTSFHATKIFNTGEGGAVFAGGALKERLQSLRFFGFDKEKAITDVGCNGKMTELHAALGLANLPDFPAVLRHRRAIFVEYQAHLGDSVGYQGFDPDSYNYGYMPVLFASETALIAALMRLEANGVFARRYFYPSLNEVAVLGEPVPCPVSEDLSRRILCLPSFTDLSLETVARIAKLVLG